MSITANTFMQKAAHIAEHFGFTHIDAIKKDKRCKKAEKRSHTSSAALRRNDALHGLLTQGASAYLDNRLYGLEAPALFYSFEQVPRSQELALTLNVFGVEKSIAEAMLIQATRALATELGFANNSVRINSLGDKESSTRYMREVTNFLRKRMDDLPEAARELMKEHSYYALSHLHEKEHELSYRTPSPLEYLSDPSRRHFRELIEFLDLATHEYEIDPRLLGHYQCYNDALFAIDLLDNDQKPLVDAPLHIRGGRYNEFLEQITEEVTPAAGAVVVLSNKKAPARSPKPKKLIPGVYVVQLGFGPKVRSLILVDELRKAGIAVHHDLANDSLSAQLRDAEEKGVPYVAIIGQKEYVENGVILRDMIARSQTQVDVPTLITKLRRSSRVPTKRVSSS